MQAQQKLKQAEVLQGDDPFLAGTPATLAFSAMRQAHLTTERPAEQHVTAKCECYGWLKGPSGLCLPFDSKHASAVTLCEDRHLLSTPADVCFNGMTTSRHPKRQLLVVDLPCSTGNLQRKAAADAVHRSTVLTVHALAAVAARTPAL